MSRKEYTYDPDKFKLTVQKHGLGSGCFTVFLVVIVLALPAQFPPPWNVIAYVGLGVLCIVGIAAWALQRASTKEDQ